MRLSHLMLAMSLLSAAAALPARAQEAAANPTLYVVRYIDAAPAAKGQVASLLRQLADASRKDAGVMHFEVLQRLAPSNQFVILEIWKDQPALDAHLAAGHAKQFSDKLQPLLAAPVDGRINLPLAVGPAPAGRANGAIYAVTHVDVNPPNMEEENTALKTLAAASRKEPGNLRFDTTVQQKGRGNHFAVIEVWKDERAADAHATAAHTKAFRATLAPLTGALYDQRWYKGL
jgi:quinol monooxygenase YgiN